MNPVHFRRATSCSTLLLTRILNGPIGESDPNGSRRGTGCGHRIRRLDDVDRAGQPYRKSIFHQEIIIYTSRTLCVNPVTVENLRRQSTLLHDAVKLLIPDQMQGWRSATNAPTRSSSRAPRYAQSRSSSAWRQRSPDRCWARSSPFLAIAARNGPFPVSTACLRVSPASRPPHQAARPSIRPWAGAAPPPSPSEHACRIP